MNRGNAHQEKGDLDRAIADYAQAIAINPKLGLTYLNRGNVYQRKGELERALADYATAIEIDSRLARAEVPGNLGAP